MRRTFLFFMTIILGLGCLAQPASASSEGDYVLSVHPASQTINLTPGEEYSGKIEVANIGKKPFTLKVSVAPYSIDGETYQSDFEARGDFTLLCDWVTLAHDTFYVEPEMSAQVDFTVNVPEDAVGGGQYAVILARTEEGIEANSTVNVIPQVAGILYGRVSGEEMNPEGELVEQKIPHWIFDGPLEVSEMTYNTGNVDFQVYHAMTIKNFFTGNVIIGPDSEDGSGQTIGSVTQVVFPRTSRSNTLSWESAPRLGVYRVEQKIIYLDQTVQTEQIVIMCPLWLIFSIVALLMLLILWIFLIIRRHKRKQPQVL